MGAFHEGSHSPTNSRDTSSHTLVKCVCVRAHARVLYPWQHVTHTYREGKVCVCARARACVVSMAACHTHIQRDKDGLLPSKRNTVCVLESMAACHTHIHTVPPNPSARTRAHTHTVVGTPNYFGQKVTRSHNGTKRENDHSTRVSVRDDLCKDQTSYPPPHYTSHASSSSSSPHPTLLLLLPPPSPPLTSSRACL